jgi:hypothetical protein
MNLSEQSFLRAVVSDLSRIMAPRRAGGRGWNDKADGADSFLEPHYDSPFGPPRMISACLAFSVETACLTYTPPKASFIMSAGAT